MLLLCLICTRSVRKVFTCVLSRSLSLFTHLAHKLFFHFLRFWSLYCKHLPLAQYRNIIASIFHCLNIKRGILFIFTHIQQMHMLKTKTKNNTNIQALFLYFYNNHSCCFAFLPLMSFPSSPPPPSSSISATSFFVSFSPYLWCILDVVTFPHISHWLKKQL